MGKLTRYTLYDKNDKELGDVWANDEQDAVERSKPLYPEAVRAVRYQNGGA